MTLNLKVMMSSSPALGVELTQKKGLLFLVFFKGGNDRKFSPFNFCGALLLSFQEVILQHFPLRSK